VGSRGARASLPRQPSDCAKIAGGEGGGARAEKPEGGESRAGRHVAGKLLGWNARLICLGMGAGAGGRGRLDAARVPGRRLG
jgi:hypothetical protein